MVDTEKEHAMANYDLILHDVDLVRPGVEGVRRTSIGVRDGKVAAISPDLDTADADEVVDGGGRLAFPGVVDAHQHWGIYNELGADAASESRACAQGGVTTALTYM